MAGADLCLAYQECPDAWNQTLKDNLAIGVALHDIKEVMVFTHQDCGAWKKFGILNKDMNLKQEIDAHREMAKKSNKVLVNLFPQVKFRHLFIKLNGESNNFEKI